MKTNFVSCKLIIEMLRLKAEYNANCCNVPMLLSSLFAVRDGEEFINLFHSYFEKKLGIKFDVIDKALDEMIRSSSTSSNDDSITNISLQCPETYPTSTLEVPVDTELAHVFEHLSCFLSEENREELTPDYFSVSLFEIESKSIRIFLKKISTNYMEAENFFNRQKILAYEIIPYDISHFITYANPLYVGQKCYVVGREKELTEIYRNMLKPVKRNVILYGLPGVGKTAVGELLKYSIANDLCPNQFKGFKVFEMSVKDFLLKCDDSKEANELMNTLLNFLTRSEDNIILLIDEIQTILGKGNLFDTKKLDLSTTLKPILVRGDVRIVGITTSADYVSFETDQALNRRFAGIEIDEPKQNEVAAMITPMVRKIEQSKEIKIPADVIDKAIWYAACFDFNKNNPDKSLDVINGAIANAQLRNATTVTVDDVINVFNVSFKRWNGMTDEVKRNTAYHEAGHYVVNRLTNPGNIVVLAVSIYPTDDYLGINVLEIDDSITPNTNKQYYYNEIAVDLAGRIAEKLVSGDITSGASEDLDSATEIAKVMITEFGMSSGIGKNRAYLMEEFGNDEAAQEVDEEVSKIIDHVYEKCEKMLIANRHFLDAVANALLQKHILMKEELDIIWNKAEKEHEIRMSKKSRIQKSSTKRSSSKLKRIAHRTWKWKKFFK